MEQLVVLTAPVERVLSGYDIAVLSELPGGGALRHLGPSAAEMPVGKPVDLPALRRRLPGIDVNLVPARGRRRKLLIADMDSTIIPVECIDEVADFAGVKPRVSAITERAMRGELNFEESLRARVALMEGLPEAQLATVYAERVRLNPGARVLVRTMARNGAYTALVSGGFTFFAERVAAAAGFVEFRANRLLSRDGRLTGKVHEPILGREAKLEALGEITGRFGLDAADVLAVGDGANDLAMIEAAGLGVAYHAKPALAERAKAVIQHSDLTALLYLQGYTAAEFVHD